MLWKLPAGDVSRTDISEGRREERKLCLFEDRIEGGGGGGHIVRLCLVKHSLWMRLKQWNQESRRQILNLLSRVLYIMHNSWARRVAGRNGTGRKFKF